MNGSKRSNGSAILKAAVINVKEGNAALVLKDLEKWSNGSCEVTSEWDMHIGRALWSRCVEKGVTNTEEEVAALWKIYELLVRAFTDQAKDFDVQNYMDRLQVFGATFKFFVQKEHIELSVVESLLSEVAKSSFHVRQNEFATFKTVCMNFYAIIWNYMRDHYTQFELSHSLAHASLSVRWLVVLGMDQFQNIGNKLSQISSIFSRSQMSSNPAIADFFINLANKIVEMYKQVLVNDSENGVKIKKSKSALPVAHFQGFLNITFVLTRQLIMFGSVDQSLNVAIPILKMTKIYFETDLLQIWKNILKAYVKVSAIFASESNQQIVNEAVQACELFRECRKQVLELNFQKNYPGYAFSFMYAFTECIGLAMSNSKVTGASSVVLKKLQLSQSVKFMKEIQLAADACIALDNMKSGRHVLEGVTENRKVDVQSSALFHVLKIAYERISDRDAEIDKDFQQVTEATFMALMLLANRVDLDKTKSADIFNIIVFHTCNIGYAYQKRKDAKESMSWCYRSIDAFEAFKATEVNSELKVNILSVGLLLADCHRQLDNFEEGLRWLSKWLLQAPHLAKIQSPAYDVYEQIPWLDWSVHWQALQKEVCTMQGVGMRECRTVVDYLEEDDPNSVSDKFASTVLRLEMNAYFSGRQTIVPALLTVGQQLSDTNFCVADKVLGLVCQTVGLWWIGTEESLQFAFDCINEAITFLDSNMLSNDGKGGEEVEVALRVYLSGIVAAWRGLCCFKMNQNKAEKDLEALKEKLLREKEKPDKDRPKDRGDATGTYAVPGLSSLTLEDETICTRNLIQATECFYQLTQMEGAFKDIMDTHCPALAQITVRLVALCLCAFESKLNAAKAWYSTFIVAKLYDRKGLIVLASSEVLKIFPHLGLDCVKYADSTNINAVDKKLIKHNKAIFYRLDLAKAIACFQLKNYKDGLSHLKEVFQFLAVKDNFDSTHHLMADAQYVLSLYRSASLNHNFEFPHGIPEMLCKMTPAGLVVKGYKLVGGLSRETDVLSSGWTDLLHNYYLLGSMVELGSRTIKLLKETGKLRELKCFMSDAVYFYQRMGIVSKSLESLIPVIEIDIAGRNFYMAQIRIAAVAKVLLSGECPSNLEGPALTDVKKFLETRLKVPGLSLNRLEQVSQLKWHLGNIETTSFHYRNRSTKYLSSLKVDCKNIDINSIEMKAPSFLRHPLSCFCYTCSHPTIIPCVLEFLTYQARYAVALTGKMSMAILELGRLHHQRSMFRILFNMEDVVEQLQPILTQKAALQILPNVYLYLFFKPGFNMQLMNMEICPVGEIEKIIQLMNSALKAADIVDSQDFLMKAHPLEIGTCALFEYFVSSKKIPILGANIRDVIRERSEQCEKENTIAVSSPEFFEATVYEPSAAPPVVRKKGALLPPSKQQLAGRKTKVTTIRPRRILNSRTQLQQNELAATVEFVDLARIDDDRHIPIIPPPNFDDSTDD